jgi:hypothetical protein
MEILDKLVTDVTYCLKQTLTNTTFVTPTINGGDIDCKLVEVKNRSGEDILVIPNNTDDFPILDGEDRVIMVKKLSDIKLARKTGNGSITVHLLIEK